MRSGASLCSDFAALCWIEAHPGLASWLQAIFSVAAVVVAILVPMIMASNERRRRQERLSRHALDAAGTVAAAIEVLANAAADAEKRKVFGVSGGYPMHTFTSARETLTSVNIADIEDEIISRSMRIISLRLASAVDDVEDFKEFSESDDGGTHWAAYLVDRSKSTNELYKTIQDRVRDRRLLGRPRRIGRMNRL